MISYWEYYGTDIDGNRSLKVLQHELTAEDTGYIREEIFIKLREDEYDYSDSIMVTLISHMGEVVDFEVEINEYITKNEFDSAQRNTQ